MDFVITLGCDCCGYTTEVATYSGTHGLLLGTIKCHRCVRHFFPMKFIHRFQDWRWMRAHLSHD